MQNIGICVFIVKCDIVLADRTQYGGTVALMPQCCVRRRLSFVVVFKCTVTKLDAS